MKIKQLIGQIVILTAVLFCTSGCTMWAKLWFTGGAGNSSQQPDPLAGWAFHPFPGFETPPYGHNKNHLNEAITGDYHNFILQNKLVLFGTAITGYYENETGQHAVEFEAFPPNQNATWHYVLIYDRQNKRIKVIKYGYTKYQS